MFRYIEKYIFQKTLKDNFNLFLDLPELIQTYINEDLITWNKFKCYVLQEKIFDKIKIDGKWEAELLPHTIEEGIIYYINELPMIKEIFKKKGVIHILCDNTVNFITCYNKDKLLTITNTIKMAYIAKTIPQKSLKTLATNNDLTGYVQTTVLADYATLNALNSGLAANVTSEEAKITAVATQIGNQLIASEGAEALVNQAITESVSNLAGVLDGKYVELKDSITNVQSTVTTLEEDRDALASTLDSTYDAVVRIQDYLAV